jgi:transcriptional regulator with XRE-family HTH domain
MVTIRQYRIQLGWSLTELANAAGLTYQTVSRMEKGDPAMDYNVGKVANALSEALGRTITVDDLEGVKFHR